MNATILFMQRDDGAGGVIDRAAFAESMRAVRRVMARDFFLGAIAALDEGDITLVQMATLLTLDGGPPFGVKALSERLGRSLSATSRLVDQLVRRRLLRRSEDPQDRRGKLLELAPAGRRLVAQLMERRAEAYLQLTERLPPREQAAVARAMTLLAKAGGGRAP